MIRLPRRLARLLLGDTDDTPPAPAEPDPAQPALPSTPPPPEWAARKRPLNSSSPVTAAHQDAEGQVLMRLAELSARPGWSPWDAADALFNEITKEKITR